MAINPEARNHLLSELGKVLSPRAVATMADYLNDDDGLIARFDQQDAALADHDRQFEAIDRRFDQQDAALADHDRQFEAIARRFDAVDERFDAVDRRFVTLEHSIEVLRHELTAVFRGELSAALQSQNRTMLLGVLGLGVTIAGSAVGLAQVL